MSYDLKYSLVELKELLTEPGKESPTDFICSLFKTAFATHTLFRKAVEKNMSRWHIPNWAHDQRQIETSFHTLTDLLDEKLPFAETVVDNRGVVATWSHYINYMWIMATSVVYYPHPYTITDIETACETCFIDIESTQLTTS